MASSLLARGKGCSPEMALHLYNAVASARILYGLALVELKPRQWDTLEADQRGVIRGTFALPRTSQVGPTLAEAHQTPISLRAKACAFQHIERMHMTREGGRLASQLLCLPNTGMGRPALEYAGLVSEVPDSLPITPHWHSHLVISTRIPGIRSKRNTPQCALLQEASALIEERYSDRLHVFTDGSVNGDGSAAASLIPALRDGTKCRIPFIASSTTAELAALDMAADQLAEVLPAAAVVF